MRLTTAFNNTATVEPSHSSVSNPKEQRKPDGERRFKRACVLYSLLRVRSSYIKGKQYHFTSPVPLLFAVFRYVQTSTTAIFDCAF